MYDRSRCFSNQSTFYIAHNDKVLPLCVIFCVFKFLKRLNDLQHLLRYPCVPFCYQLNYLNDCYNDHSDRFSTCTFFCDFPDWLNYLIDQSTYSFDHDCSDSNFCFLLWLLELLACCIDHNGKVLTPCVFFCRVVTYFKQRNFTYRSHKWLGSGLLHSSQL